MKTAYEDFEHDVRSILDRKAVRPGWRILAYCPRISPGIHNKLDSLVDAFIPIENDMCAAVLDGAPADLLNAFPKAIPFRPPEYRTMLVAVNNEEAMGMAVSLMDRPAYQTLVTNQP